MADPLEEKTMRWVFFLILINMNSVRKEGGRKNLEEIYGWGSHLPNFFFIIAVTFSMKSK